jgi:large subunit ribosomal protein L28
MPFFFFSLSILGFWVNIKARELCTAVSTSLPAQVCRACCRVFCLVALGASPDRLRETDSTEGIGAKVMAQICQVCGKGPQFGNNVSHAHNITKRRWNVNLRPVKAKLESGANKRIRVCTSCIKSGKVVKA